MTPVTEWGCVSKQSFASRYEAARTLVKRARRIDRHQSRGKSEAYRFGHCGTWHVGAGK